MGLTTVQRDCAACDSKAHTGFRLVPKSVTLNGLKRHNDLYFCAISLSLVDLGSNYVKAITEPQILDVPFQIWLTSEHVAMFGRVPLGDL